MRIKELINERTILFDGAMGTYLTSIDSMYGLNCEQANEGNPELVKSIHREYIEAGAQVITSNTYAANRLVYGEIQAEKLIKEGFRIAADSAGDDAAVVASIGQINGSDEVRAEEFIWMAQKLIDSGARDFIFETQNSLTGISECAGFIKKRVPDSYIIAGFAVNDSGFTNEGIFAEDILLEMEKDVNIDAAGFNCGCSAAYMNKVVCSLSLTSKPLVVMPNLGSLSVIGRKTVFKGDPQLFADKVCEMAGHGAVLIGGCCGTTPDHIRALAAELEKGTSKSPGPAAVISETEVQEDPGSSFFEKLRSGLKPIAVELDPPQDANASRFLKGVEDLKDAGIDIITIADCPIGRARMDSSLLACKVYREYGIEALPHMTCRDRNLNATQALMLGLYAEGIRNILLVTGDPVPSSDKDSVKAVYQFNSRKFASFASSLSEKMFKNEVHFFGALNVNARNFDIQLKLAKEKTDNGICGFLTQPVLTQEAFDNLKKAKDELNGYILGGIIPVVSEKNARFMDSEIHGINIDRQVIEMYAGKDREEAEKIAVEISSEIARQISPYVDGYYYMTPFQRTSLIRKIIEAV